MEGNEAHGLNAEHGPHENASGDQEEPPGRVRALAPLARSKAGGSGSFLVRADDGRRYWCKTLNNTQGSGMVPVNEQIVARVGRLIGAAACEPILVEIPHALAGWEFRPGHHLEAGWAHGGLAVQDAIETHSLDHRTDDDNAQRHAGFFALHDWLGGTDAQWLYSPSEGNAYYSHDHGHYFWGPNWTPQTLAQHVADPAPLEQSSAGLDQSELERLATVLEELTQEEIAGAVENLPDAWPIGAGEVESVVDFAYNRRSDVAARVRQLRTEDNA